MYMSMYMCVCVNKRVLIGVSMYAFGDGYVQRRILNSTLEEMMVCV